MKQILRRSWMSVAGATLLMAVLTACSPTIPKIDSLKIGKEIDKDKDVTKETAAFAPKDTIYGYATASAPGKVAIKWQVIVVKADGVADNFHIPGADASVDLPGSGSSNYNLPPPADGFPAGKYRIEVHMVDETGTEKDAKTMDFTVASS